MKLYADLDVNKKKRELFMNIILADYENGFRMIEELFGEPASIRRNGQYDNLKWCNEKLFYVIRHYCVLYGHGIVLP